MLYDPKLDERLAAQAHGAKLAPTLSFVSQEGEKIRQEKDEYKNLLQELAESDFVKEMKRLQTGIIG